MLSVIKKIYDNLNDKQVSLQLKSPKTIIQGNVHSKYWPDKDDENCIF